MHKRLVVLVLVGLGIGGGMAIHQINDEVRSIDLFEVDLNEPVQPHLPYSPRRVLRKTIDGERIIIMAFGALACFAIGVGLAYLVAQYMK